MVRGRLDDAVDSGFVEPPREHLHRVAYVHDLNPRPRVSKYRLGVREGTYEAVRDVLDIAPLPVRRQNLESCDWLAPEDGDGSDI